MEIFNQIASWGFGTNLSETKDILDNTSRAERLGAQLNEERKYYGYLLLLLKNENENVKLQSYILVVVVLIIILILANVAF